VKTKLKQLVIFSALAIFFANITGAIFLLHIVMEGGCEDHDCDHCPICRNTFVNSVKIINTPSTAAIGINSVESAIEYNFNGPLTIRHKHQITPRAPPA
jgi:hypothetical protein